MNRTTSLQLIVISGFIGVLALIPLSRHMTAEPNEEQSTDENETHGEHEKHTPEHHSNERQTSADAHPSKGDGKHRAIQLPASRRKKMGVHTATPRSGSANARLVRPATVQFDPDRRAKVGPVVQGRVQEVMVVPGDRVDKGEPVARLNSVRLGKAKASYLSENARARTRNAAYERQQNLRDKEITSQSELDLARAKYLEARSDLNEAKEQLKIYGLSDEAIGELSFSSDRPLATTVLRAPMEGMVQERSASKGDIVRPGDHPIHIVQHDRVWIMTDAYEKDLAHIEEGNRVTFRTDGVNGKTFTGTVEWISLKLDRESRTAKVRAVVENNNQSLRAGMYGQATIHTESKRPHPMVPAGAVQELHGQQVLFVPGAGKHEYQPVPVEVGDESEDGWVEVVNGLDMDQEYVKSGAFDLKSVFTARSRSAAHSH